MKGLFTMSMLCLVLFWTSPALADNVTVTASGKDAATAELNARVAAVRQVLQETAAMDFLVSKMDLVRKEFILKSRDFTSTVTLLSSEKVSGAVRVKATVETDRDKIRQRLIGIDPKAVAAAPAPASPAVDAPPAVAEAPAPASEPAPVPQAAAPPSGPALPDEEFLTMLALSAPVEERLAAIRNGANPNAAVTDWDMSNRILKKVPREGRVKKEYYQDEKDAVFPGKTALMLVADDPLSSEADAIAVMEALVAAGADINAKDYSGRNVLMYMQKHFRPDFFTAFLAHKPDLEAVMDKPKDGVTRQNPALSGRSGGSGRTPLLYSFCPMVPAEVKPVVRKALLRAGADPNKKMDDGAMFLPALAASSTDLELFTLALESGAQPYAKTLETLLKSKPERENRMPMIEALLKLDTEDKTWKQAGLYEVCKKFESPELIRLFLKHGADVNAKQSLGYTLLMLNGIDARSVPPLVEAGAKVNYQNSAPPIYNRTALMFALENKKPDLALALLAAGADPNLEASNFRFKTALMLEVMSQCRADMVKALLDAGADPTVPDSRGDAPILVAAAKGPVAVMELLKAKGQDVNTVNNGETPLFHAARANNTEVVEWLIKAGADVAYTNEKGQNALNAAMENSRQTKDAAELLIKAGIDVNADWKDYGTPLIQATRSGAPEILIMAKLLLENGANVNASNTSGRTALMRAVGNSSMELVAILLDAGADPSLKDEKGRTAWDFRDKGEKGRMSVWEKPENATLKRRLHPPAD